LSRDFLQEVPASSALQLVTAFGGALGVTGHRNWMSASRGCGASACANPEKYAQLHLQTTAADTADPVLWRSGVSHHRLIPGDPALVLLGKGADAASLAGLRADLGLDRPLPLQFVSWCRHALQRRPGPLDRPPASR